ncbi:MAG: hypothetical protein O2856_12755 [Planctomycetota bacterium]|nr:hypothetical protein [Planctomycetota bacterium]
MKTLILKPGGYKCVAIPSNTDRQAILETIRDAKSDLPGDWIN